jgi:hypothetical protein
MPNVFSELAQSQASLIEAQAKFVTAAGEKALKDAQARLSDQQAALTDAVRRDLEQQIEAKQLAVVEYRRALNALHQEQATIQDQIKLFESRGRDLSRFNEYEGLTPDLVTAPWIGCQFFLSKATDIARWASVQPITPEMRAAGNWCHVRDKSDRPPPADIRTLVRLVHWGQVSAVMPVAGSPAAALMDTLVDRLTNAARDGVAACQAHQKGIEAGVAKQWPAMEILAVPLPPALQSVISKSAG